MPVSQDLTRLIEANAPLWAGEAEIVRTYWTSPVRNREAEKLWLKRQCWKEFVGISDAKGNAIGRVKELITELTAAAPTLDITLDRNELKENMEKHFVEYTHYCLFADLHDSLLEPGEPTLRAHELSVWPEEDTLAARRRAVRQSHGKLGSRATGFTEGGYCTLYSEGAKLKGHAGLDGRIGIACQKVFDDEFGHMMWGVLGIDDEHLSKSDWDTLIELTMEQLRMRLTMRNAQFSHPLTDARIKEIVAGKIEPVKFDHAKAETYMHAAAAQ